MNVTLIAAAIGILAGAIGYWVTTFWMQPILRYRSIRNQIHSDFIYYAQVVNADGLNEEMQDLNRERILANRKSSADLFAISFELPAWYKLLLKKRNLNPEQAAKYIIGYSNACEYDNACELQENIRQLLGLPKEP